MAVYNEHGNLIGQLNHGEQNLSIIDLNYDIKEKLIQARRPKNIDGFDSYLNRTQPVVLLWFSDIHEDQTELERIIEIRDKYNNLIDDTICTGDMAHLRFSDGMDFWYNTSGSDNIMMVIGNHDALAASSGYDWTNLKSESDQYDRYFAPNISKWGCSYTSGKTYYYKDYIDKKLRVIALNVMLTGDDAIAQKTWLANTLSSAKNSDLSVVVVNHCPIEKADKVNCNFNNHDSGGTGVASSTYLALSEDYLSIIQDFIDDGGKFICHLAGHSHSDRVLNSQTYTDQYCFVIGAAQFDSGGASGDIQRTMGEKTQDLANIIVFDTDSEVIKIIRVGADINHYCIPRRCLTFKYRTGEIFYEY